MSKPTAVSDLERAEHLNYADSKGVKRVSAFNNGVQVNVATEEKQDSIIENQTDGSQKTQIVGSDGEIASVTSANGQKGLVTVSPGHISTGNSSSTALLADGVFTGDSEDVTNFGVIVLTVKSDVASATDGLSVQQSTDDTNWDCTDVFTISADTSKVFSFQTCAKYFRVVYTNGGTDQTYFRLQTILKPYYVKPSSHRVLDNISCEDDAELNKSILTGLNAGCDEFANIEATYANSLKSSIYDGETGRRAEVESLGALKTETPVRLVGTTFSNGTKDPNFWTEAVAGTGSVTQAGEIILATGATANSTAKYYTNIKARKITGATNQFRAVARNVEAPSDDCIRRIGAYNTDDGFFMQFDGTTFGVVSRKNGTDIVVENGSLNGNLGATIDFGGGTDFSRIVIEYTALSANFFLDGNLIHTITPTTTSLTNSLNLPVTMEIINENGNTDNNSYQILFATILRLGELATAPNSFYQSGTTTGEVLKYNAGIIRGIVVSGVANNSVITLYDNTAASGTVIWSSGSMGSQTQPFSLDFNELSFDTGLTLVISGSTSNVEITYE